MSRKKKALVDVEALEWAVLDCVTGKFELFPKRMIAESRANVLRVMHKREDEGDDSAAGAVFTARIKGRWKPDWLLEKEAGEKCKEADKKERDARKEQEAEPEAKGDGEDGD